MWRPRNHHAAASHHPGCSLEHEGPPDDPGSLLDAGVHPSVSTAALGHSGTSLGHPGAPLTPVGPPRPTATGPTRHLPA